MLAVADLTAIYKHHHMWPYGALLVEDVGPGLRVSLKDHL
jgi:hypothetical protein